MIIGEHTIDIELIPKDANILDIGCRGFEFQDYFKGSRWQKCKVYNVDIDELGDKRRKYYRMAIASEDGMCGVKHTEDPNGKHIIDGNEIPKMTIESFSKHVGVEQWDLIKMDIEGAEYEILNKAIHPIAKQVSVEFHAHASQTKWQIDVLLEDLSKYYDIHNRVWEERHCAGFNYWDILLVSKDL